MATQSAAYATVFSTIARAELEVEKWRSTLALCSDFSLEALYHYLNSQLNGITASDLHSFLLKHGTNLTIP